MKGLEKIDETNLPKKKDFDSFDYKPNSRGFESVEVT